MILNYVFLMKIQIKKPCLYIELSALAVCQYKLIFQLFVAGYHIHVIF